MTRPQFLAATAELGLNPRQAMDRLKVRSLEGLNLREALESLRRQMLGASAPQDTEPEPEPAAAPTVAAPASAASDARYFEEEDDETIFFTEEDDDDDDDADEEAFDEEPALPVGTGAPLAPGGDLGDDFLDEMDEEVDLEDVPDLAPPSPAPRRRAAPSAPAAPNTPSVRESATEAPPAAPSGGARTQAMQLIGRLRATTGGGPASDYQRNAYRNIVENELGKTQATALVRGLWRTTADRLSAGQLDALIRWGKEEVFAEEAALALAALRAEARRADQSREQAAEPATPNATRPRGRQSGTSGVDRADGTDEADGGAR
jgi:hypothetical protein